MNSKISVSLHNLMRGPLLVAQLCALFPVRGTMAKTSYKLKFSWYNYRILYSITTWLILYYILYITLATEQMDDTSLSILNARLLDVIAPPVAFFPLVLQISYKWRQFVNKWETIEKRLPVYRTGSKLESILRLVFVVFVSSRLGYVFVEYLKTLWKCIKCLPLDTWSATVDAMFRVHYHQVFIYTAPAVWKYIGLLVVDVINALQWISCSLLITFLSLILTVQFRNFNSHLEAFKLQKMTWEEEVLSVCKKSSGSIHSLKQLQYFLPVKTKLRLLNALVFPHFIYCNSVYSDMTVALANKLQLMPNTYWQEMREAYNNLSQLTILLDSLLSPLILVTFIMETLNIIVFIYGTINCREIFNTLGILTVASLYIVEVTLSALIANCRRDVTIMNITQGVMMTLIYQRTELPSSLRSPHMLVQDYSTYSLTISRMEIKILSFQGKTDDSPKDTIDYVLAAFGCARVVLVNLVTQLSVCAIFEESKRPLEVFRLVPSLCYCKEVERLYEQVATDTLALTGCQFFYVTRSVILTMVSTIVTYEVVLIQFGEYQPQTLPTNSSTPEYCDTWVIPRYNTHL